MSKAMSETAAPGEGPAPLQWPEKPLRHERPATHPTMLGEEDASAWALPYTDLTMLLMVFFIVMLSVVGPNPSASEIAEEGREEARIAEPGTSAALEAMRAQQARDWRPTGGAGLLPAREGFLPQERPAEPERPDAPEARAEEPEAVEPPDPPTQAVKAETEAEAPPDFASEWARRIESLGAEAERFLEAADLEDVIQLEVTARGVELRISEDLLFASGAAELQDRGAETIARLAPLLTELEGEIQISGHTDNLPIRTARFPSNWELSAARAIEVVRLLRRLEVPEAKMQAVGYGANRPIAPNSTAAGRATNRRVTIDLSPQPSQ